MRKVVVDNILYKFAASLELFFPRVWLHLVSNYNNGSIRNAKVDWKERWEAQTYINVPEHSVHHDQTVPCSTARSLPTNSVIQI